MQSKTIINFAALILCLTVSFESVYGQTAGNANNPKNIAPRKAANVGKTVKMPALPNAPNGGNINQKPETTSANQNSPAPKFDIQATDAAKKDAAIRIGISTVKTGKVGEGVSAVDLAGAVQQTLGAYFKGTKIELVPLEARLAAAQADEIREKQCDFILDATVSHKKGGGGFGKMFGSIAPVLGAVVPGAGLVGMIAGSVAGTAISGATANIKPKDEITLDLKINAVKDNAAAFAKQYKAKAKKGGEDLITPLIEQAAQEILDQVAK